MKTNIIFFTILLILFSFCKCTPEEEEHTHVAPTHNSTIKRLLIFNDKSEILMVKVASNWYPPSLIFDKRQYINESLDSLANAYGIAIKNIQLKAYISFKYEYHQYATLRPYYTSDYKNGDIKIPTNIENVKWMSINEVIEKTPVESMKQLIKKITDFPDTVWGGSFMVFRKGEEHHTRIVEKISPLFQSTEINDMVIEE